MLKANSRYGIELRPGAWPFEPEAMPAIESLSLRRLDQSDACSPIEAPRNRQIRQPEKISPGRQSVTWPRIKQAISAAKEARTNARRRTESKRRCSSSAASVPHDVSLASERQSKVYSRNAASTRMKSNSVARIYSGRKVVVLKIREEPAAEITRGQASTQAPTSKPTIAKS